MEENKKEETTPVEEVKPAEEPKEVKVVYVTREEKKSGPDYTATKAVMHDYNILIGAALFILGILPGIIYLIYCRVVCHHCILEFYEDKYVLKTGVFNTRADEVVFKGTLAVSVYQSLRGKIFHYGTVKIDVVGKHDLTLYGVLNPYDLEKYIKTRNMDAKSMPYVLTN